MRRGDHVLDRATAVWRRTDRAGPEPSRTPRAIRTTRTRSPAGCGSGCGCRRPRPGTAPRLRDISAVACSNNEAVTPAPASKSTSSVPKRTSPPSSVRCVEQQGLELILADRRDGGRAARRGRFRARAPRTGLRPGARPGSGRRRPAAGVPAPPDGCVARAPNCGGSRGPACAAPSPWGRPTYPGACRRRARGLRTDAARCRSPGPPDRHPPPGRRTGLVSVGRGASRRRAWCNDPATRGGRNP